MTDLLFYENDLRSVLTRQEQAFTNEIDALNEEHVLNTSPEDLCNYFVEKYTVNVPEIDESRIHVDYGDAKVGISHRFEYFVSDRSRPAYVTGTRLIFNVPFTGDYKLFQFKPSSFNLNPPRAAVKKDELVFVYDRTTQDAQNIEVEFERDKENVKGYLEWIARDVEQFNSTIREKASQHIGARREKLLQDRGLVEKHDSLVTRAFRVGSAA